MPDDKPGAGNGGSELDDVEILYVGPDSGEEEMPEKGLEPAREPDLRGEIERLKAEVEQYRDLYLRKLADFDNFRKRMERDREEMRRIAGEALLSELVPVLDNFERALAHPAEVDPAGFRQGVAMISRQLWESLQRQGMACLNPLGERFDPQFHEAVQRVEDSEHEPETVVAVHAKGYTFGGRLVRPALVAVAVPRVEPKAVGLVENGPDREQEPWS
jgi:molecular chaperone GrpE